MASSGPAADQRARGLRVSYWVNRLTSGASHNQFAEAVRQVGPISSRRRKLAWTMADCRYLGGLGHPAGVPRDGAVPPPPQIRRKERGADGRVEVGHFQKPVSSRSRQAQLREPHPF
jgi:hypothetical protein